MFEYHTCVGYNDTHFWGGGGGWGGVGGPRKQWIRPNGLIYALDTFPIKATLIHSISNTRARRFLVGNPQLPEDADPLYWNPASHNAFWEFTNADYVSTSLFQPKQILVTVYIDEDEEIIGGLYEDTGISMKRYGTTYYNVDIVNVLPCASIGFDEPGNCLVSPRNGY